MVVRGILTPEGRELARLTRRAEADVALVFDALNRDVQAIFAPYGDRPLTPADRMVIRRRLDTVIDRYFGSTQARATRSILRNVIVRNTDRAAAAPMIRQVERLRSYAVPNIGQDAWDRVYRRRLTQAYTQTDPLSRILVGADINGPATIRQRALRAGRLDVDRKWVPRERWNTKTGYSLSDRLWSEGQTTRRAIDDRIRRALREGTSADKLAIELERHLKPQWRPIRDAQGNLTGANFGRPGVLTRSPWERAHYRDSLPDRGWGSFPARRLARTEISRVHAASTLESARATPGLQGVRWRVSASHRGTDICDQHARNHSDGLPPGVYTTGEFPLMPSHPMCTCVTQMAMKSREDVLDEITREFGFDAPIGRVAA